MASGDPFPADRGATRRDRAVRNRLNSAPDRTNDADRAFRDPAPARTGPCRSDLGALARSTGARRIQSTNTRWAHDRCIAQRTWLAPRRAAVLRAGSDLRPEEPATEGRGGRV